MGVLIHGHTVRPTDGSPRKHSPEYNTYSGMKDRCYNTSHVRFKDYGGKGIVVCERWMQGEDGKTGFECFLEDMGQKPNGKHSIERKKVSEGYHPDNCRWASHKEQSRNKTTTRWVEIGGQKLSLAEAVEKYSTVSYYTVRMRIQRGWNDLDAIFQSKS